MMKKSLLVVAALAVPLAYGECARAYPEHIEEGFVSLFDGETLLGWEGDRAAFSGEERPYVGMMRKKPFHSDGFALVYAPAADGHPQKIYTKKEYDNFVLRFDYFMPTNGVGTVGLRTALGECPCKAGVAIALADDFGFEKGGLEADRFSGSIVGVQPSRREPNIRLDWKRDSGNTYAKPAGRWNMVEVRAVGERVTVMLNGEIVSDASVKGRPAKGRICLVGKDKEVKWMHLRVKRVGPDWRPDACPCLNKAPAGFTALFDGKSLAGWKGVTTEEQFDRPWVRQAATPEKRAEMQAKADALMRQHWAVRDGALFFDGKKGGYSLATAKDYKDFEMYADWRILCITGDSGIYPRGVCQIQIWDAHNMWHLGSGGLYNNKVNERHAMSIADREAGDWNRFYVKMVGDRVTVRLNGVTVVDDIPLENANAKKFPGPIPAIEQIELQCHGDPLEFRNLYIREL